MSHAHADSGPQGLGVLVVRGEGSQSAADGGTLSNVQLAVKVFPVDVEAELLIVPINEDALLSGVLTLGDNDSLFAVGAVLFQVLHGSGNVVSAGNNTCLKKEGNFKSFMLHIVLGRLDIGGRGVREGHK